MNIPLKKENFEKITKKLWEYVNKKDLPSVTSCFSNRKNWTRFLNREKQTEKTITTLWLELITYSKTPTGKKHINTDELKSIGFNSNEYIRETSIQTTNFTSPEALIDFFKNRWKLEQTRVGKEYQKNFNTFLKEQNYENRQFIRLIPQQSLVIHIDPKIQKDDKLREPITKIHTMISGFFNIIGGPQMAFTNRAYAEKDYSDPFSKLLGKDHKISVGYKFFPGQLNLIEHQGLKDMYDILLPINFDWHITFGNIEAKNFIEPDDQEGLFLDFMDTFERYLGPKKVTNIPKQ